MLSLSLAPKLFLPSTIDFTIFIKFKEIKVFVILRSTIVRSSMGSLLQRKIVFTSVHKSIISPTSRHDAYIPENQRKRNRRKVYLSVTNWPFSLRIQAAGLSTIIEDPWNVYHRVCNNRRCGS